MGQSFPAKARSLETRRFRAGIVAEDSPLAALVCNPINEGTCPTARDWEEHWRSQVASAFGAACSFYRRHIRARSVAHYFKKYFPSSGVFAECGSGTSETSCRVQRSDRTLIAVDWSDEALSRAAKVPQIAECVRADIRALPFPDRSIDGIWNLGVMEHFHDADQLLILKEFHRVLKPNGNILLWWPPRLALDHFLLSRIGWRFPSEPGRVTAHQAESLLRAANFDQVHVHFPANDAFTELVVHGVARSAVSATTHSS